MDLELDARCALARGARDGVGARHGTRTRDADCLKSFNASDFLLEATCRGMNTTSNPAEQLWYSLQRIHKCRMEIVVCMLIAYEGGDALSLCEWVFLITLQV